MKQIVIIGGGASSLVCAINLARNGKSVTILEKNSKCGKKLLITGNGKCNFWNKDQNIMHYHSSNINLLDRFITNKSEVLKFFDSLGLVYKEKNNYYYPFTGQAQTIYNLLLNECNKLNIEIINDIEVTDIVKKDNFIIKTNKETIEAKNVILATGSKASPKTGSDGLGYALAQKLGHKIITPLPSLVQLHGNESYFKNWSGIRADVKVSLYENNKYIKSEIGEIQLTNYGVSGICIFNLSGYVSKGLNQNKKEVISINFMPFAPNPKEYLENLNKSSKTLQNLLECFMHYKLVDIILKKSNIKRNLLLKNLSKIELENLINTLTNFQINITNTNNFEHAQVCSGGISLEEINSDTMESLKAKNLYLIGEIVDIDGDCGGYNLGWAWMSAIKAGKSVR